MTNTATYWASYAYLYGFGGLLFFGIIAFSIKKGALVLNRKGDRQLLLTLIALYAGYSLVHGVWIIWASRVAAAPAKVSMTSGYIEEIENTEQMNNG